MKIRGKNSQNILETANCNASENFVRIFLRHVILQCCKISQMRKTINVLCVDIDKYVLAF